MCYVIVLARLADYGGHVIKYGNQKIPSYLHIL